MGSERRTSHSPIAELAYLRSSLSQRLVIIVQLSDPLVGSLIFVGQLRNTYTFTPYPVA
jgi:hypothetical protein